MIGHGAIEENTIVVPGGPESGVRNQPPDVTPPVPCPPEAAGIVTGTVMFGKGPLVCATAEPDGTAALRSTALAATAWPNNRRFALKPLPPPSPQYPGTIEDWRTDVNAVDLPEWDCALNCTSEDGTRVLVDGPRRTGPSSETARWTPAVHRHGHHPYAGHRPPGLPGHADGNRRGVSRHTSAGDGIGGVDPGIPTWLPSTA